jgi:hypothetical protein
MDKYKKLYRVTLKGMTFWDAGTPYGLNYVVATDPTEAYDKVRKFLDEYNLGFPGERELDTIELIADSCPHPYTNYRLYL